jgi:two-component system cell cycle sensor histidine kinase/response regulator CckA
LSGHIKLLVVEDRAADAELVVEQLRQSGFVPDWQRVETEAEYQAALATDLDLIIAELYLGGCDALRALDLRNARNLDVPFVIVSGVPVEDDAVRALREGADDCVRKDRLEQLGPAVARALAARSLRDENRRVREALERNEELFRKLSDCSPVGIMLADAQGGCSYSNPRCRTLLGLTLMQTLGDGWTSAIHPADRDAALAEWSQCVRQRREFYRQFRLRPGPDGASRWLSVRSALTGHGEFGHVLTFTDVTDRMQAEQKLRDAETKYRLLVEQMPAITYIAESGAAGRWHFVSPQLESLLGYSPQQWLARPEMWHEQIHPDDRERVLAAEERVRQAGGVFAEEYRLRRRDGRYVWVRDTCAAVTDEGGAPCWLQGVMVEVTAQKEMAEALQSKSEQLEAITEAMLAFLQDGDWRQASAILLRSALKQTGSEYGFLGALVEGPALRILAHEGIRWSDTVNYKFYEQALAAYREQGYLEFRNFNNLFGHVITTGQPLIANQPDADPRAGGLPPGHPPLRHFLGVPVRRGRELIGMFGVANRPGGYSEADQRAIETLTHAAGVLFDSHRRQQRERLLEDQLLQSQKLEAVGQLAGGVAHDFNNILTAITGYSELAARRLADNDPARADVEEIRKAAERAGALTRQLLAFSRRQVLQPEILDLDAVVADMENMLRRLLGEIIELEVAAGGEPSRVLADRGQIEQVIINLAVNARDAMPRGGRLRICTGLAHIAQTAAARMAEVAPGEYVTLTVSDEGAGMTAEVRARIFEPFFTTKPKGKGTGLGLATCFGIVKQSGGHIEVDSELGKGTTFRVYLPRAQGEPAPQPVAAAAPHGLQGGSERILLVEDEHTVRELAAMVLRDLGYEVTEAANGQEALELARTRGDGAFDLVISDVVMPRMGGPELIERLRELGCRCRAILTSGYTEAEMDTETISAWDAVFLGKPYSARQLAAKVRETLGARPATAG